jgi:hypothetical protein
VRGATLALITSYLYARQKGKEWHPPLNLRQFRDTVFRYYYVTSPSTRDAAMYEIDARLQNDQRQ